MCAVRYVCPLCRHDELGEDAGKLALPVSREDIKAEAAPPPRLSSATPPPPRLPPALAGPASAPVPSPLPGAGAGSRPTPQPASASSGVKPEPVQAPRPDPVVLTMPLPHPDAMDTDGDDLGCLSNVALRAQGGDTPGPVLSPTSLSVGGAPTPLAVSAASPSSLVQVDVVTTDTPVQSPGGSSGCTAAPFSAPAASAEPAAGSSLAASVTPPLPGADKDKDKDTMEVDNTPAASSTAVVAGRQGQQGEEPLRPRPYDLEGVPSAADVADADSASCLPRTPLSMLMESRVRSRMANIAGPQYADSLVVRMVSSVPQSLTVPPVWTPCAPRCFAMKDAEHACERTLCPWEYVLLCKVFIGGPVHQAVTYAVASMCAPPPPSFVFAPFCRWCGSW